MDRRTNRTRQIGLNRCLLLFAVSISSAIPQLHTFAQSKPDLTGTSSLCNRDDAVGLIKQQIEVTRTFDGTVARIAVLIRAADLLWPFEQAKARAAFNEAFDLATQNEKENSERKDRPRSLILSLRTPDQRYVVIRAVTKRDSAFAKKLTQQMLKAERPSGETGPTKDEFNDRLTAYRLLGSASQLIAIDINSAVDLARVSLNYPAGSELTRFLYKVAEVNQQLADQFYDQALVVYANATVHEFLYLSAYPFALSETRNPPVFASYVLPANFVPNHSLQRRFVQNLLRRAQQALESPSVEDDNLRNASGNLMPGTGHILQVLVHIEPNVRALLPDLSQAVVQMREKLLVSLSVETQKTLLQPGREVASSPATNFDEQIETAEKTPNVNLRDDLIAMAVLNRASEKESLAEVLEVVDKITDRNIREHVLEWLYFTRVREAVTSKRFDEAERLVSKVEGREQRAYLRTEIAKGLMNTSETQSHAREVLEEAITEANKAGATIFAARTLLAASNLYSKVDLSRSIAVLENAIDFVNHISNPDFLSDDQTLVREPRRRSNPGNFDIRFYMPGLDPETAFREMAKINFDGALSQANAFTDKYQRAVTTLASTDACLQTAVKQPKGKLKKPVKQP